MAGDACIQQTGCKDFSFLGNRTAGESCRHGVAVLESHGLYAGGSAGRSHSAAKVQVRIPGKTLSEQVAVWRPIRRIWPPDGRRSTTRELNAADVNMTGRGPCRAQEPGNLQHQRARAMGPRPLRGSLGWADRERKIGRAHV